MSGWGEGQETGGGRLGLEDGQRSWCWIGKDVVRVRVSVARVIELD